MAYNQYRRGMYPQQQGSGFYNPMMKGPDIAGGIQGFMQQLAGMKQMQSQREQQTWKRGIVEREIALKEEEAQKQPTQSRWDFQKEYAQYMNTTGQWTEDEAGTYLARNEVPQKLVEIPIETKTEIEQNYGLKDFNQLPPDKQVRFLELNATRKGKAGPRPTQFDKKKVEWDKRLKAKKVTQEEYDEAVWGIKPKPSKEDILAKGANPRQANDAWLKDVYKNMERSAIEKEAKKSKSKPVVMGIALDMPYKYNLAVLNKNDGLATPSNLDTISKYDGMFRYFNDVLLKGKALSFKEFMKLPEARDPDFDKAQIKKWYEYYEGILYEKGSF